MSAFGRGGAKLFPPFFSPLLNRLLVLKLLLLQLMLLLPQRHRALRDQGSYIEEEENNSQKWQQCPSALRSGGPSGALAQQQQE